MALSKASTLHLRDKRTPPSQPKLKRHALRDEEVALRIIDLRGRVVARLAIPAGVSIFEWNGQGGGGARPGSGKYFLTLGDEAERAVPFVWLD